MLKNKEEANPHSKSKIITYIQIIKYIKRKEKKLGKKEGREGTTTSSTTVGNDKASEALPEFVWRQKKKGGRERERVQREKKKRKEKKRKRGKKEKLCCLWATTNTYTYTTVEKEIGWQSKLKQSFSDLQLFH